MKIVLSLILFIGLGLSVSGQGSRVYLHLANGSVVRGRLVETNTDQIIIESKKNRWVFTQAEVDSMTLKKKRTKLKYDPNLPYYFDFNIGVLYGNSSSAEDQIGSFQGAFNYKLVQRFYGGAGAGMEHFMEKMYIPAFLKFDYRLRPTRSTPYLSLKTGYIFPGEDLTPPSDLSGVESRNIHPKYLNAGGGFLIHPGLGYSGMFGENFGYSVSVGYRYNSLKFYGDEEYELEQRYNRLTFALGIIFK